MPSIVLDVRQCFVLSRSKFIPDLLPYVYSAYSAESVLLWDDVEIISSEGK